MVHVARPGHADAGVQQQCAVDHLDSALGQLLVDAVERVARLKGDHIAMAGALQAHADLSWQQAQLTKVVARRQPQHPHPARDIQRTPALHLDHQRVTQVARAEDSVGDFVAVPAVDLLHRQDGQEIVRRSPQRNVRVQVDIRIGLGWQRDWNGKERPACQPHLVHDALMVQAAHEAVQRREAANRQQLQVAHRALGELHAGQPGRVVLQLFDVLIASEQIDEPASIRRDHWAYLTATDCRPRASPANRAPANTPISGNAGVVNRSSTPITTWTTVRNTTTARKLNASAAVPSLPHAADEPPGSPWFDRPPTSPSRRSGPPTRVPSG